MPDLPRERREMLLRNEAARTGAADEGDCRCLCGSLLARLVSGGVELKCRRCKRTLLVPFEPGTGQLAAAAEPAGLRPARKVG
jgi:hypothetical protein